MYNAATGKVASVVTDLHLNYENFLFKYRAEHTKYSTRPSVSFPSGLICKILSVSLLNTIYNLPWKKV